VCQRILPHRPDAEDAFQATFLLLTRKAGCIRKRESVGAWLHGAAYRIAAKARTESARRHKQERLASQADPPAVGFEAAWRELQGVLDEELQRLPKKQRAALLLCYLEGRTHEEAARQLGWPVGTVKSTLARARDRLRLRLTRRGLALSASAFAAVLAVNSVSAAVPMVCRQAVLLTAQEFCRAGAAAAAAPIAALAQAGAKTFLSTKAKLILALATVLSALGVGAAALMPLKAPVQPPAAAVRDEIQEPKDRYGDPLPPGAVARLGTIRFRSAAGGPEPLLFTQDGQGVLTAGRLNPTRLWKISDGKLLRQFGETSREYGNAIKLSPDGKVLATRGEPGGRLRLWDLATGKLLVEGDGETADLVCLAFSPDGKMVASAGTDNKLRLWDVATGGAQWVAASPTGRTFAIAFLPDGKTLAVLDEHGMSLWDAATGKAGSDRWEQKGLLDIAAFSPDGDTLAVARGPLTETGEEESVVCVVDTVTLKEMRKLAAVKGGGPNDIQVFQGLALSPDGKLLAAATSPGRIRLWHTDTGKEACTCQGNRVFGCPLAFSADGKMLAGMDSGTVRFWEAATGKEMVTARGGHKHPLSAVAFASDGATLISRSWDSSARIWDPATGEERRQIAAAPEDSDDYHLIGIDSAASPDGKTITLLDLAWPLKPGPFGVVIRQWDMNARREVCRHVRKIGEQLPAAPILSPDGTTVAFVPQIDGPEKELQVCLLESATGKLRFKLKGANPAYSTDGKLVATTRAGEKDDSFTLWDTATGKELCTVPAPAGHVYRVAFSPDGKMLATVSNVTCQVNNTIHLWTLSKNKSQDSGPGWRIDSPRVLAEVPYYVWTVAISPDNRTLALPHKDTVVVRLLETTTGKERARFAGHIGEVRTLAFAPDGRLLATGSFDTTVLVWDLTGRLWDGRLRPARLSAEQQDELWADLAADDAGRAGRAVWTLAADPERILPLFEKRLRPIAPLAPETAAKLIRDLDDDTFEVRVKARRELERLDAVAAPAMRHALENAPSAEARTKLEDLLTIVEANKSRPSGEALRGVRAVEVLEHIDGRAARQALADLAAGAPESLLTHEARASLERLESAEKGKDSPSRK
jgi:RNA polymerase sigma factor (sigma-70 family)